ncbi:MAG: hypothetical protein QM778_03785 [Myxococcales bacterium]
MRTRWRLVYALSTLVCACAGSVALVPRKDDGCGVIQADHGHALHVYLAADRTGDKNPLCPGQVLTGADTLWASVEVSVDCYVRMIFVTPDGQTGEVLRTDSGRPVRQAIFQAPRGLLTRASGEAQLVVVASRKSLSASDPAMASMLEVIRETGVLVDEHGRLTPPLRADEGTPEDQLLNLGTRALYADFDEHGVAVLTLSLHTSP